MIFSKEEKLRMRATLLLFALTSLTPLVMPIVAAQAQPQPTQAAPDKQEQKEMVATVETVNAEQKTIKVQEMKDPIVIDDSTVFDDDVQLSKLHAGVKVKLVGTTSADGKFHAAEVRAAK